MQRYQPPHARQRDNQNASRVSGPTTGEGSTHTRTEGRTPREVTHKSYRRDAFEGISEQNVTGQAGPSNYTSLQPVRQYENSTRDKYTPRLSKKDWSNSSQSRSALASPSGDIKPMRKEIGTPTRMDGDDFDFELIQSVSRSGGDGAEGDALKSWDTQERYRSFINRKIDKHYSTFGTLRHTPPLKDSKNEWESLSSIVLLFRKLREGVVASGRIDDFAIEVFESSAQFSILANNKPQLISSLSGLIPGLYQTMADRKGKNKAQNIDMIQGVENLTIRENENRKNEFTSLYLLYQLTILGEKEFWSIYFQLTQSPRKYLKRPFDHTSTSYSQDSQNEVEKPFITTEEINLSVLIARSISFHSFDPIRCFKLVKQATTYERVILSWGEDKIRERAWEVMRKAYMSNGIKWAERFLGVKEDEMDEWVERKGLKVDHGIIKLR
ncbi:uncharacterized protein I206_102446 [Kwoniella pini CBS 10737]|uniref:Uncharacterized protein n=1 Tax=Kwoniella pini CBS 10737 TaxID=1296096 RepID=A0A1B9I5E5_9TREE|nr:uncharacterized protein I206_02795 [Kwoniella pini CBS 10737]OCF50739.1 hypothetical protein I206_02795 [Kwoniella pini CBS 10737]